MERYERLGRRLVLLGVAITGSLGVFALVTLMLTSVEPGSLSLGLTRAGGGPVTVLLLGVLIGFVILLVQVVRGGTVALGCGGLLGLILAVAGFGLTVFISTDTVATSGVAYLGTVAAAAAGLALAIGALLRLLAGRSTRPSRRRPSDP